MAESQGFYNILVFGFRRGLIDALESLKKDYQLSYTLVLDKIPKVRPDVEIIRTQKFPINLKEVESMLEPLKGPRKWSHVIACVEGAVLTASLARRVLNARLSKDSTIIKCYDKYRMKQYLSEFGIPMTKFMRYRPELVPSEYEKKLGYPIVSKQRISSGGRGLTKINSEAELVANFDDNRIYEAYVDGEELSVESFIHQGEIKFSNITRYYKKKFVNVVPGNYSKLIENKVLELNKKIIDALKISWGITHCEMYQLKDGSLYFGEIAIRPPGGEIMDLITQSYEFDSWMSLLKLELGLSVEFPKEATRYSAVIFFHPGKGLIKEIKGVNELSAIESLLNYKVSAKEGDRVEERMGVSENIAQIKLVNKSFDALIKDVDFATKTLHFIVK